MRIFKYILGVSMLVSSMAFMFSATSLADAIIFTEAEPFPVEVKYEKRKDERCGGLLGLLGCEKTTCLQGGGDCTPKSCTYDDCGITNDG